MCTCLYIQVSVLYVHVCVGKSIWVHTCVCVSVGQSLTSSVSPSCSFSQSLFTKSDYPGGPASPRCPPDPAFQALGFKPATLHLFFFFHKVVGDPNSGPSVCVVSTSLSHLLTPAGSFSSPRVMGLSLLEASLTLVGSSQPRNSLYICVLGSVIDF